MIRKSSHPSHREGRHRYKLVVLALKWGGVPYKLIEAAAGEVELITSTAILTELRNVLGRERLASRLAARRSMVEQAIVFYAELAISAAPLSTPRVVPGDVDDDQPSPLRWPAPPRSSSRKNGIYSPWAAIRASASSMRLMLCGVSRTQEARPKPQRAWAFLNPNFQTGKT